MKVLAGKNFSKEIEDINNQMETLEVKNTVSKIKNSVDGFSSRMANQREESD